jgi:hypothetical protein
MIMDKAIEIVSFSPVCDSVQKVVTYSDLDWSVFQIVPVRLFILEANCLSVSLIFGSSSFLFARSSHIYT